MAAFVGPFTFQAPDGPLAVGETRLELSRQGGRLVACWLRFQLDPAVYARRVDPVHLFHLTPEVRGPNYYEQFAPWPDLEITVRLKADLLPRLSENATTAAEAGAYLQQTSPPDPLRATASWYALSVTQPLDLPAEFEGGTVKAGYRTTWADTPPPKDTIPMIEVMTEFLTSHDFDVVRLDAAGNPALQLEFKGDNGQWVCYAVAQDRHNVALFYSTCPVEVPPARRPAMMEFLTRANYGMRVGNFEMDVNDGQIRYKTSLDLADQSLTPDLFRQLMTTNVILMDRYLPGIVAVAEHNEEPARAIARIESG